VICKHCGAEVSPYITECPYCGNRIQKRAPKLDRDGRIAQKKPRRPPSPTLGRLRRGEMPGIRHDAHPYGTILLVALGFIGTLLWRTGAVDYFQVVGYGSLTPHWWKVFTAPFVYDNIGYAVITLAVTALFGVLMERRHGPAITVVIFLLGAVAGIAVSLETSANIVSGANGGALALLVAWAMPDLITLIRREDFDGDLIGAAVLAGVVALMPLVTTNPPEASWISDAVGIAAGVLLGYPLARLRPA
jgi:membrane associated rhomboid family serine protease